MTTTVTVQAHCDKDKVQVRVKSTSDQLQEDITILQDGEQADFHAYYGKEIIVREIPK